jgi:hypothetical protein
MRLTKKFETFFSSSLVQTRKISSKLCDDALTSDATSLIMTTLSIMDMIVTLSIMGKIVTISIMDINVTLSIKVLIETLRIETLNIMTLSIRT